jgi:flagellar protein FliO/FliZ
MRKLACLALLTLGLWSLGPVPAAWAAPPPAPEPAAAPGEPAAAPGEPAAAPGEAELEADEPPAPAPVDPKLAAENAEVIRLAAAHEGDLAVPTTGANELQEAPSMAGAVLQMIFVLGAVCLLAYLLLGKVMPRLLRMPMPGQRSRLMRVVERLPVDQRRSILLVAVGEEYFLVGASEGGLHLISRMDAERIRRDGAGAPAEPAGLSRFAEAVSGRGKES